MRYDNKVPTLKGINVEQLDILGDDASWYALLLEDWSGEGPHPVLDWAEKFPGNSDEFLLMIRDRVIGTNFQVRHEKVCEEVFAQRLFKNERFHKYVSLLPRRSEHFPDCDRNDEACVCLEELWYISDHVLPKWIGEETRSNAIMKAFRRIND